MKPWRKRKLYTGGWRFILIDCLWLVSGCHIISGIFYNFFKKQVLPGTDVLDEEYTERERLKGTYVTNNRALMLC